jgi:glycosyltransferase involved in cell wall biosynthesis
MPWVLVAGGFHQRGGMDKANAALAAFLLEQDRPVHLVAHEVEGQLARHARADVHLVPRPGGSFLLGAWPLARAGQAIARRVIAQYGQARVVVNGGNCVWPGVNWVHSVHQAWPSADDGAPLWFKAKNRVAAALARRNERSALEVARLVIANSERTRQDLIRSLGAKPSSVSTVYLGADPHWGAPTSRERADARAWIGVPPNRPLIAFVGNLSHDRNKGIDTLLAAFARLCTRPDWDADLVVAGDGLARRLWEHHVASAGLGARVRFLGFTTRVANLLSAADLLVSPVRYEAFGLSVQEAICRGVPTIVSAHAGVAEHYPQGLREMLLPKPTDVDELAERMVVWRSAVASWKQRFELLAQSLRRYTWSDMAARIVALTDAHYI